MKLKLYIPNALTIIRIILTPIIMIFGLLNHINIIIILTIIASLTDLLDGRLARKWNVTTVVGAKLDAVADKLFAIGTIGCLLTKFSILWIPFALEIILGITNLYYYFKNDKTKSLMIGKIKTTFLFTTVIIGIITTFNNNLYQVFQGMIYATINLQVLSIFKYGYEFFNKKETISIEDNIQHKKIMDEVEEYDKTMILEDLQKLAQEYEYNNDIDDIY